ncbi:hypothetical protein FQN54_005621 [Arachnomyces sp. PD_36]|nr:hypothetical protein FQN54_005621 [Arachnomyces sp. PD_36]
MGRPSASDSLEDIRAVQVVEHGGRSYNSTLAKEIQNAAGVHSRLIFGVSDGIEYLDNKLGNAVPESFVAAVRKDLNGCFGSHYNRDSDGTVMSYDTWCCFKIKEVSTDQSSRSLVYVWHQIAMLTRWHPKNHTEFVLFLDMPPSMQKRMSLHLPSIEKMDAFAWHTIFFAEIRELFDSSIWSLRDLVRAIETARGIRNESPPDFPRFHEIARHIIHSNETLDVAIDTVDGTIHEHESFLRECGGTEDAQFRDLHRRLYYSSRELWALKRRSESLYERLQNEINLAFNLISQRDSQIAVQVGQYAQKDSNMMKTMAAVGLVFLPGTFVSSFFGMNFFDFDPEGQRWFVSDRFWLYWAITCPLTILTIMIWAAWHYWTVLKQRAAWLLRRSRELRSR